MAGTAHSRTWISAEIVPGSDAEEKAEHRDISGAIHKTSWSTPMSHFGWLVESQNHQNVGV